MRYIGEVVVTIPFTLPEMLSVFLHLLRSIQKEILQEAQNDHFSDLELKIHSGKEDFIIWYVSQHTLVVLGKLIFYANPIQCLRNSVRSNVVEFSLRSRVFECNT